MKGHVEPREDTRVAAIRELREKSGFSVKPERLVDLGAVAPEAGVILGRIHLYEVEVSNLDQGDVKGELGHGAVAFFDWKEIRDLIAQGELEDATTISLLFKHGLE